jgi:hypothetical protein
MPTRRKLLLGPVVVVSGDEVPPSRTRRRKPLQRPEAELVQRTEAELAERDGGWFCALYGLVVNPEIKHGDPRAIQMDHIVPRIKGGMTASAIVSSPTPPAIF